MDPTAVAAAACDELGPLLAAELTVTAARTMAVEHGWLAVVTVRDRDAGGTGSWATRNGSAVAGDEADAVRAAVRNALVADGDVLATAVARLAARGVLTAALLGERALAGAPAQVERLRGVATALGANRSVRLVVDDVVILGQRGGSATLCVEVPARSGGADLVKEWLAYSVLGLMT